MKNETAEQEWMSEYRDFLASPERQAPVNLTRDILQFVHRELNPGFLSVFRKMALLHIATGSLSLLLCSQFGMGQGLNLAHVMMRWGELACMVGCGCLFLGTTSLVANFLLSNSELRRVRSRAYMMIILLSVGSLLTFIGFGAEVALIYAVAWLLGAIFTGVLATELSFRLRSMVWRGLKH